MKRWISAEWVRFLVATVSILLIGSCGPAIDRNPVPEALADAAAPFGKQGLRNWGDTASEDEIDRIVKVYGPVLRREFGADIAAGRTPTLDYLALSGGGQWGAFGAGVLKAWSDSGRRPNFRGVSGVSTGAIIATFAFLGPEYDDTLKEIYSLYGTDQLVEETLISGIISGDALSDTTKLAGVIAKYVTPDIVDKIAQEHRKGRRLLIGTTNLDAGRPVSWDIGAIANSGEPGALDLIRSLIRASAAIPVAFPPVLIKVETPDGKVYDEMHVDGGASSQVIFVSPEIPIATLTRRVLGRNLHRRLWVIVNNDLVPPHQAIRPRVPSIAGAAVSSLIRSSGTGDLYQFYTIAERDEMDFRAGWIPSEVPCPDPKEDFDRKFMRCLFEVGAEIYRSGKLWRDKPPYFAAR